jgi:hypothetical protein
MIVVKCAPVLPRKKEKKKEEAEEEGKFSYGFRKMTVKKGKKGAENKEVHQCESAFIFILQGKEKESCSSP